MPIDSSGFDSICFVSLEILLQILLTGSYQKLLLN